MRVQPCGSNCHLMAVSVALLVAVVGVIPYRASAQLPIGGTIGDAVNHGIREAQKQAAPIAQTVTTVVTTGATAAIAPTVNLVNFIAGDKSLGDAAKGVATAQGEHYAAIGEAVSATNAASNNIQIVAAEAIGGDVGKTVMTIGTGPQRLQVEFASDRRDCRWRA